MIVGNLRSVTLNRDCSKTNENSEIEPVELESIKSNKKMNDVVEKL